MVTIVVIFCLLEVILWLCLGMPWNYRLGIVVPCVLVAGCFISGIAVQIKAPIETYVVRSTPLHNIEDNTGISGHFFLGSGTIESVDSYSYYLVMPDGSYQPNHMAKYPKEMNVFVNEDASVETARLEELSIRFADSTIEYWFGGNRGTLKYVFHIPPHSITTGFSLK